MFKTGRLLIKFQTQCEITKNPYTSHEPAPGTCRKVSDKKECPPGLNRGGH